VLRAPPFQHYRCALLRVQTTIFKSSILGLGGGSSSGIGSGGCNPPLAAAVVFLLSHVARVQPAVSRVLGGSLSSVVEQAQRDGEEQEQEEDDDEERGDISEPGSDPSDDYAKTARKNKRKKINEYMDKGDEDKNDDDSTSSSVAVADVAVVEIYQPSAREPKGSHASSSCAWEMALLARHYHPSVRYVALFFRKLNMNAKDGWSL
jgi:hypothetical protein